MKKVFKAAGIVAVVAGVVAIGTQMFSPAPVVSKGAVYGGKMYVAGHGGHIAVADVQIDPTADKPITIAKLDRIEIGTPKSHPFHDVRIDPTNRDLLFYSTYKLDATEGPNKGKLHSGSVDLKGEKVVKDIAFAPDAHDRGRRLHGRQLLRLRPEQGLLLPGDDGHGGLHRRHREDDDGAEAPRLRRLARRQDRLPVHARQHLAGHEELPARGQQGERHPEGRLGHHRASWRSSCSTSPPSRRAS